MEPGSCRAASGRFILHGATLVIAAVRTGLVRLFRFMAVRALPERRLGQKVVRPPSAGPSLRVAPFWVRHCNTPRFRLMTADCMGFLAEKLSLRLSPVSASGESLSLFRELLKHTYSAKVRSYPELLFF